MKHILDYIIESIDSDDIDEIIKVKNLRVTYSTNKTTVVEVPNSYSENDMQIYLDDTLLDKLPCATDESKEALGDNYDEIGDAYFTYSKFTASDEKPSNVTINFDNHYDSNAAKEKMYYSLDELKYIVEFSEFNLKNIEESKIKEEIESIFASFESNSENKYPIEINFESVEFNK